MSKYGLVGINIQRSLSPKIYNFWFNKYNITAQYNLLDIKQDTFDRNFINKIISDGYMGLNFTQPFKEKVIELIDNKSEEVKKIKAVNNLVIKNNSTTGYNTDYLGLLASFKSLNFDLTNKNILILGAGGAARSLLYCLNNNKNNIYIKNRTIEKINLLLNDFTSNNLQFFNNNNIIFDVIFNATTLTFDEHLAGLFKIISKDTLFFDLNYYHTNKDIIKYSYVDGLLMLLHQAVYNFDLWFNIKPNIDEDLINYIKK